ncbi:enoyl-CoA hydratase [Actinomadura geliboluensis]|uniref:enoyl-CoA hydratase n=1 Tax=Actinomadura geliboluensis TaxID=882440 RepID=A0A5S4HJZ8_9ACTN|nr:enoyl-CoA hydratase [Actinomadura geliboluensis]TMR40640.1 enoyl-CoA hydratase [Actinomadura geliboluensis]
MANTLTAERIGRTGVLTLNRPSSLNALGYETMVEITTQAIEYDRDPDIGAIVVAGSGKAFAAGADIKEMRSKTFSDLYRADWFAEWDRFAAIRTPVIAAVAGYALGGGCELAMMCDIIIAADTARFGQPEVRLGIPPGIGGSQRLPRAIGKAKAMDMLLTARMMPADEAERSGLVSRVVPAAELMETALAAAAEIGEKSLMATTAIKECVHRAYESGLAEGVRYERRAFFSAFATHDQSEGMAAFTEKRQPGFQHR